MNLVEKIIEENRNFEIAGSSIIGTRKYQQDYACLYSDHKQVFGIICDGMGGLNGGEQASRTAVETFVRDYLEWKGEESLPEFLETEAARMDRRVAALRDKKGEPLRSGTTVVVAIAQGDCLYWLSVGDSKIYVIRGKGIRAVTREHNYRLTLKEDMMRGRISRRQYEAEESSRQAEALTSYLGMGGLERVDVTMSPVRLEKDDIILLCSDGVYKSLEESQIYAMVRDNDIDMEVAADRLTSMALEKAKGGQDNTTAVLIAYRNT